MKAKLIKSIACLIVFVAFWFIPVPNGLTESTWHVLGLYLGTVLGVILRPFPEPVILMTSIAILSTYYLQLKESISAFAGSTSWLILTAFIIGECFILTGLGKRIAWDTFVWYSGIISISDVLTKGGFFLWLGKWFQHTLNLGGVNLIVAMGILLLLSIVVRYFFASTIAYVVTFVPVIFTLGAVIGIPPIPLLLLIAASAQIASVMTHYGNAVGPLLFGAGYVPQGRW